MQGQARYEMEILSKTRQALFDTIAQIQQCPKERLSEESIKFMQMRFQALLIELRKAKIQIPYIALEPNNGQCLNNFNSKQLPLIQNQVKKHRIMIQNFQLVGKELECNDKRTSKQKADDQPET